MSDISEILDEWPYDPSSCVRKITAEDGRELLQVRTPLGLEQYELAGRPDGARPYDCESVLEYVEAQLRRHVASTHDASGFEIEDSTAAELQQEALLYYYRYLVCFQIGEYNIVAADTARNLRVFDLLKTYCHDLDAEAGSEQYRPYVIRMNAAARALLAVGRAEFRAAKTIVEDAIGAIQRLASVPTPTFDYEKNRSLAILRGMLRAVPEARPQTPEDVLKRELHDAVAAENYERAAEIRDRLSQLETRRGASAQHTPELMSNDES